jgi:hypothetical protein
MALWALFGCSSGAHSPVGFRLPPTGDAEKGKVAFIAYECHGCHTVAGQALPKTPPVASIPVVLGGEVPRQVTNGHLVTSIIYPSYKQARMGKAAAREAARCRMPDYTNTMTVRELTDIVAFLQTTYSVQRAPDYPAIY